MRYYIGLDNGGTTTKAAIFDSRGKQLGSCSMETAMLTPKPEFIERDMEEMWAFPPTTVPTVMSISGERTAQRRKFSRFPASIS